MSVSASDAPFSAANPRAESERLEFLSRATDVLASSLDYDVTLSRLAWLAIPFVADWCIVDMLEDEHTIRRVAMAHASRAQDERAEEMKQRYDPDVERAEGVPKVLRSGRAELVERVTDEWLQVVSNGDDVQLEILRWAGLVSYIGVPLIARGRTLGVISFVTSESGRVYTGDDLAFAEDLARRAALAVDNARLVHDAQAAEHRYRELLASVDAIVWEADAETWQFSFVSDRAEEMLGYPVEQWMQTPDFWVSIIHPEDRDRAVEFCATETRAGNHHELEYRAIGADGRVVWLRDIVEVMLGESGRAERLRGIMIDVTRSREAEEALRETEERLHTIVANSPVVLFALDSEGRFTLAEGKGLEAIGLLPRDVVGVSALAMAEQTPWIAENVRRVLAGETFSYVGSVNGASFEIWYTPLRDRRNAVTGAIGVATDVTERVRAEAALRKSEEQYRELFENANDIVYTHDLTGRFLSINRAAEIVTGYSRDEISTMSIAQIVPPDLLERAREMMARKVAEGGSTTYELEMLTKDGRRIPIEVSTRLVFEDGAPVAVQGIARDISERKEQMAALEYQALHDSLTDLPNRALLHDRIDQAIRAAHRDGSNVALLLMDLNHFKEVNDTLGHHKGDLLLQEIGPRLRSVVREADTVARLGGDEFGVVLPGLVSGGDAIGAAKKILRALERPFLLEGMALDVSASIGISVFPEHGEDPNVLIQRADVAMYTAKRASEGYMVYASEHDLHTPTRLALMGELRRAIESGELILHYQPKLCLADGTLCGLEALVRWRHPRHGMMLPEQFVPLAEQTGMVRRLDLWVLREALGQIRAWEGHGIDSTVSVNLSARTLQDPKLPERVARLLRESGVSPERISLEITESAIMADPARAMEILHALDAMGLRIAIDDFGTGYWSLSHLKALPVTEIKIDKSFVTDITVDESNAVISRSTIDLSHNLGMKVVAEGVEDRATWDMLASLGCDLAQGYYLGAPSGALELPAVLADASARVIDLAGNGGHGSLAPRRAARPRRPS